MKRRCLRRTQALRSNLAIVGDDFHRQTGQFRRGRGNAPQSLVTKKMLKKDLLWLALTGLDKDVMEFSLNARRVNEGFLFEQTAQIRSLLRQTR
ncbi:hypothetical protein ACM43_10530 [Bradyrhizobium sp. CCBAU 45321]|nr:hypothetical protein [Bradyrhizobium sp. CCBAU 45321]